MLWIFWEGQAQNCKHNFVTETTNGSQKESCKELNDLQAKVLPVLL